MHRSFLLQGAPAASHAPTTIRASFLKFAARDCSHERGDRERRDKRQREEPELPPVDPEEQVTAVFSWF